MTDAADIEAAQFRAIERLRSLLLAGGAIAPAEEVRAGIADAINLVQGAIYDARSVAAGVKPRPFTGALNDVPATLTHDEGAYAQCGECGRYTLNPRALTDRPPPCDCGSKHGWCGSFKRPGPDAKWSASAPGVTTCWGLSSFCAEVGHKCRAAGRCVYAPPNAGVAPCDGGKQG